MRVQQISLSVRCAALAAMLLMQCCGTEQKYDWKNRDIAWTYGPQNGGATSEHLAGSGKKGPGAIAVGWKCRLSEGKTLTVKPYQLSASHALFGKVIMIIGLFDKTGKQLETVRSEVITAEQATSSLELTEELAKSLYDVVIWFRKPS